MKKYKGYALITGASEGIGLEYAKLLAKEGYDLVLVARNLKKLESAASLIKKNYKVKAEVISQDLTKVESTDAIIDFLKKKKIHVGILINNVGFMNALARFHEVPRHFSLNMINTMCVCTADLTHQLLPGMLKEGSGAIIFMSSLATPFSGSFIAVYNACKSFEMKLAQALHAEYTNRGIDVLAVCPDAVNTNFFNSENFYPPATPMLDADEVAKAALGALGKKIVLVLPASIMPKIGGVMSNVLPYTIIEKVTFKVLKQMWPEHSSQKPEI